jgi:nicotinate phosphoribosyltransferase
MPNNSIFLVDTYDSLEGTRHAVEAGKLLRARGHTRAGIGRRRCGRAWRTGDGPAVRPARWCGRGR